MTKHTLNYNLFAILLEAWQETTADMFPALGKGKKRTVANSKKIV